MRKTARQQQIESMRQSRTFRGGRVNPASNDFFFDKWEDDFDKSFRRTGKAIILGWIAFVLVDLAFLAVIIWAIVQLVQWVTAK